MEISHKIRIAQEKWLKYNFFIFKWEKRLRKNLLFRMLRIPRDISMSQDHKLTLYSLMPELSQLIPMCTVVL